MTDEKQRASPVQDGPGTSPPDDPRCATCRDIGAAYCNECAVDVAAAASRQFCAGCPDHEHCAQGGCSSEDVEARKEVAGTRRCTNWRDSCHGDPDIDGCICEARAKALTAAAKASPPIPAPTRQRCARDSDWCDGVICRERGIECPNADPAPTAGSECVCGHVQRVHAPRSGLCHGVDCQCEGFRPTLNQHVTGDESSPVISTASEAVIEAAAFDLYAAGPYGTFEGFRDKGVRCATDAHSMEVYRAIVRSVLRSLQAQGTGHEQVIPAAEFAKDNAAWHERVQRAVDEIPRGEFIPAAKLREFIAAIKAEAKAKGGLVASARAGVANCLAALLDEHATQPTALDPDRPHDPTVRAALEFYAAPATYMDISTYVAPITVDLGAMARTALSTYGATASEPVQADLPGDDREPWERCPCPACQATKAQLYDEDEATAEDHESGPAGSTTDGPASPREGST